MPRSTPRVEREWLSCTKPSPSAMPSSSCHWLAIGLTEEAALVDERRRLDRHEPGETGRKDAHRRKSVAACLYSPER